MLYEPLTGKRMFKGADVADTITQVLTKEPDLACVPPQLRKLLRRCLEKNPKRRLRDIGEARYLVEESGTEVPRSVETRRMRHLWPAVAAALAMISSALGWMAWNHLREEPPRVSGRAIAILVTDGFEQVEMRTEERAQPGLRKDHPDFS
jgi:serine/threonine-protein kinase